MQIIIDYALDFINGRLKDYIENISADQVECNYTFRSITFAIKNVLLKPQFLELIPLKLPLELVDGIIPVLNCRCDDFFQGVLNIECEGIHLIIKAKDKCNSEETVSDFPDILRQTEQFLGDLANLGGNKDDTGLTNFISKKLSLVISYIYLVFKNTTIDIEYSPENSKNGIGLRVHISSLNLSSKQTTEEKDKNTSLSQKIEFDGISFSTLEYKNNNVCKESSTNLQFASACSFSAEEESQSEEDKKWLRYKRQVMPVARFIGTQKITTYSENADIHSRVPGVEMEINAIVFLITPRQVHLLLQLFKVIFNSYDKNDENVLQKPMTMSDYKLVQEEDLERQKSAATGLQSKTTWSSPAFDETYLPKKVDAPSLDESFSSALGDPGSLEPFLLEDLTFKFRCDDVIAVILHEDILNVSNLQDEMLTASTVQQLNNITDTFFSSMVAFLNEPSDATDKTPFVKSCKCDHLRLTLSNIKFESCQEKSKQLTSNTLWVDNLELLECLNYRSGDENKVEDIKLFYFEEMVEGSPNISFIINDANGSFPDTQTNNKKIVLKFSQPTLLLDISITERMFALLNPSPVFEVSKVQNVWNSEPKKSSNSEIDFRIEVDTLNLKLIFPIPDFRPSSDYERRPWWKRNVRDDYLFIEFNDLAAGTKFSDRDKLKRYFVQSYSATIIYFEGKGVGNHLIAKIMHDKKKNNAEQLLSLHVDIHPEITIGESIPQNPMPDLMTQSTHAYIDVPVSRNLGPFSSKISLRTITIPPDIAAGEPEKPPEPVLPGDKEEITEFIKSTKKNTTVEISVDLPVVECQILSKHIYEVIYNRINNDLLMWESGALNYQFQMNPLLVSDSEDEDEDSESVASNLYFSTTPLLKQSLMFQPPQKKRTDMCIDLKIRKGLLTMLTPVRDSANKVMPCQNGEFLFSLNGLQVFIVKGYEGDENLGYVVAQVLRLKMYHLDARMTPTESHPWRSMECDIPLYLHPTIYKLQEGINISDPRRRSGGRDMVSVAVRIYANEEVTPRSKMVTVALGINRIILNYKMCKEPNSWISQLMDFFNVMDQPIVGYEPNHIMTELHLHVWNSAIDYRPLYIPNRGFLTISLFTISTQLSEVSNSTTTRFIAESATFHLGRKRNKRLYFNKSLVPVVNLEENYIPVVEVDLFEIGYNTNDKSNPNHPEFDVRMYNNNVSISMCADSAKMFEELLKYIANDGDLTFNNYEELVESNYSSQLKEDDNNLLENSPSVAAQHKHLNEMMGDALEEEPIKETPKEPKQEAEVYMFNDDSTLISNLESTFPQVKQDLGDVYNRYSQESDTDDEYFIVEDSDLLNFPRNNTAEMEWIDDEECEINEEHFSTPKGPTDFLKAPKGFPVPIKKFVLCNMNIKFQIFGGDDFEPIENRHKKKVFAITDCATFTKGSEGKVHLKEKEIHRSKCGGYNRCRDTLVELRLKKIQYQYESYPEHTRQSTRHAFVVNEVEILDRLKKSQINKLLYSHITDKRPARSQTPMVLLRSIYVRPKNNKDLEECYFNLGVTPLRANIDQDTLLFLMDFTDTVSGSPVDSSSDSPRHATESPLPVLNVNLDKMDKQNIDTKRLKEDYLILLEEYEKYSEEETEVKEKSSTESKSNQTTFFKNVTISEISIKVDYHGKVDVTELVNIKQKDFLMNFVCGVAQLKSVEFTLKRINHQRGLLGVEKLYRHCCKTWGKDILDNQLSNIIRGVSFISALYYFMVGLHDLFVLPVRQYKKDGRIMWGMQQGANSFTVSTASAFIELALKFLAAIKITAEHAYIMVSPHPSAAMKVCLRGKRKKCYKRPLDIREGMANALTVVKEGFGETATNIVQVATYEHERKGYSGAVGGVLRQIPALVVDPVLIATEATVNVLTGAQCHVDRDMQAESKHKWKSEDQ